MEEQKFSVYYPAPQYRPPGTNLGTFPGSDQNALSLARGVEGRD